jgi:cyclophilin family peptidyl-prolyl cis-trans isomerase
MRHALVRSGTVLVVFAAALAAQEAASRPAAAEIDRLAALLRLEDLRIVDPAAWATLDAGDEPAWTARVALARRRVFEDPFEAKAKPADAAALVAAFSAEHDDLAALRIAAHDLARASGALPPSAAEILRKRLGHSDGEVAGFAARGLAKVEGAGDAEAAAIAAAFLDGGERVAQIDRLRALSKLPGGPARPALLAAVKSDDPHLRRTAFETLAAVAESLAERDRRGLGALSSAAADADPVDDVRAAAVDAYAALDRDGFMDGLARFRLGAPWPVRAAVARRLGLAGLGRGFASDGGFVDDPDRRVRQALFEAAAEEVEKRGAEMRQRALDPSFRFALSALLGRGVDAEGSGVAVPDRDDDPVEIGLRAKLMKALLAVGAASKDAAVPFLNGAVSALPAFEVEPLQFVTDLAEAVGGKAGTFALGRLAENPRAEAEIRARATAALKRLGVELPAERSAAYWGDDPRAPYRAAAARALDPRPLRAKIRTDRGEIVVRLRPDVAPLTVENFVGLARNGFFDGLLFHRVVPGFVAQAGCPRGDGFGGPGRTIRCETSDLPYERGTLGMALAGKDTGGSQWFLTHRGTPHLNGKYAVFGAVESGFEALDALVQGDRIRSVTIE